MTLCQMKDMRLIAYILKKINFRNTVARDIDVFGYVIQLILKKKKERMKERENVHNFGFSMDQRIPNLLIVSIA